MTKNEGGCIWEEEYCGPWHTQCGHAFEFTTDGVKENGFVYCCWCGRKIEPIAYTEEDEVGVMLTEVNKDA